MDDSSLSLFLNDKLKLHISHLTYLICALLADMLNKAFQLKQIKLLYL